MVLNSPLKCRSLGLADSFDKAPALGAKGVCFFSSSRKTPLSLFFFSYLIGDNKGKSLYIYSLYHSIM